MADACGSMNNSLRSGSTDIIEYCYVCHKDPVSAYCVSCTIYLCQMCIGRHKALADLNSHRLLTDKQLSPGLPTGHKTDHLKPCPHHPNKELELVCDVHNDIGCIMCFHFRHKQCKHEYIPDVCRDFNTDMQYRNLTDHIQSTEKHAAKLLSEVDVYIKEVDKLSTKGLVKFLQYKAEIIANLNKQEQEIRLQMKNIQDQDMTTLQELKSRAQVVQKTSNDINEWLKSLKDKPDDFFIATKRVQYLVAQLQSYLDDISLQCNYKEYELQLEPNIEEFFKTKRGLADVIVFDDVSTTKVHRQPFIHAAKLRNCEMRDIMSITNTKLLISAYDERKVKLIDSEVGGLLDEVSVPSGPHGICRISRECAAVALTQEQKIQLVQTRGDQLTLDVLIIVQGCVHGISSIGDRLVVSYLDPPGIEVIAMDGRVLHHFDNTNYHFEMPNYLTTSTDGFIYVSDSTKDRITKLDSSLNVIKTLSSPLLQGPRGVASVNRNQLLVASRNNNRVVLLNTNTGEAFALLQLKPIRRTPGPLSYNVKEKTVYVANSHRTTRIHKYKLTYAD